MKALVVGLGSIGKRHIGNMEAAGFPCADIVIVRREESPNPFGDDFLRQHPGHPIVHQAEEAFRVHQPGIVFVTNPTSLHIPAALEAARHGAHLFIEKPLSHSLAGLDELQAIVKDKNLTAAVGFNHRFHPLLQQIREWLGQGRIGRVVAADAAIGERVCDWHPWEDYKISYASREDLGGGAILTQSHEIDYLCWLFGRPQWVFASGGSRGELGIEVEDVVKSIIGFPGEVDVSLHLDYLRQPPERHLEIIGTQGRIRWDYYDKKAVLIPLAKEESHLVVSEPEGFERNSMFIDELRNFLECVKTGQRPEVTLEDGRATVEVMLAMRESMKTREVKYL